jgi:hypothetical protein
MEEALCSLKRTRSLNTIKVGLLVANNKVTGNALLNYSNIQTLLYIMKEDLMTTRVI